MDSRLVLLCISSGILIGFMVSSVSGHALMTFPRPRQLCQKDDSLRWRGVANGAMGGGSKGNEGGLPGFCGDPVQAWDDSNFYELPCEPQAEFEEGSMIELSTKITGNHGGFYEWSICETTDMTEECFAKNKLIEPHTGSPYWYIPYYSEDAPYTLTQMKLPDGVTCDHCVLMWTWWTNHICTYDCDSKVCNKYSGGFNAAIQDTYGGNQPKCKSLAPPFGQTPQIFRNCMDIKIVPKGTPVTMPMKVARHEGSPDILSELIPPAGLMPSWKGFPAADFKMGVFENLATGLMGGSGGVFVSGQSVSVTSTRTSPPPPTPQYGANQAKPTYTPPPPPQVTTTTTTVSGSNWGAFANFANGGGWAPPSPPTSPAYPSPKRSPPASAPPVTLTAPSPPSPPITSGWGSFYSRRLMSTAARLLLAKPSTAPRNPYKKFADGLCESDAQGLESITPVSDGMFHCGDKRIRKIMIEINEKRRAENKVELMCSNKAAGAARTQTSIMCGMHSEQRNEVINCRYSKMGKKCKEMAAIGGKHELVPALSGVDFDYIMDSGMTTMGLAYTECDDDATYWTVLAA